MTKPYYRAGCSEGSKECGKAAVWCVNFNNGNVNNNHRNNNACVRAVRSGEYHGDREVSLQELHKAWRGARSGKKPSQNQLAFDARWADGLLGLQRRINDGSWEPGRSACFVATRPKAREIHAPDFADRVVHHWLVPQLEKLWEPAFIFDSYANRKGKGSHAAVRRLQKFVRQVDSGQHSGWYLQLDIHNFFNSIHRPTLWAMLKKKLTKANASNQVMHATHALLRRPPLHVGVIYHGTAEERAMVPPHKRLENARPGCGLPIGNLSSQFFANVYLDKLDQFVKHTLKAKRYLRYVDDFVIVHSDRNQLAEWQRQIVEFIDRELQLRLKPDIRLRPLKDGIDFLGYIVRPTHTLVRRRVVTHARQALSDWQKKCVRGGTIQATPEQYRSIASTAASYEGHFRHANSARLKQKMNREFPWLPTAIRKRKFDYRLEERTVPIKLV
ncbi:RNA-directed DNA polymerase [Microbulbifer celer]|uniref:Reverse transcriptase domain-containing protein n=1 Tax=Microbulbifer celer TaxID=435905 RepID=A0ABW3U6A0_9GAMM|nr:RNA-directed DNA polymerase [Microbulbifer celer]UFN58544.1 RNA-directed DNA polymerase [Microbulbifer celer]